MYIEDWILIVLAVILAVVIGSVAYGVYDYITAEKFELVKADWSCTKSHEEMQWQPVFGDKGQITGGYPIYHTICDQWSRK